MRYDGGKSLGRRKVSTADNTLHGYLADVGAVSTRSILNIFRSRLDKP